MWLVVVCRLVVTVTTISLLAACGSDSGSEAASGVGAEFGARALDVCQETLEDKQEWRTFPVADFDPAAPDPSKFGEVADWLEVEVSPTFGAWLDDLKALGLPPSGQEAWDGVLTAVERIVQLNADQIAAAKGSDAVSFAAAADELGSTQEELVGATEAAGVPECADVHA